MPCAFRIILVFDILDLLQLIFNSLTHLVICFWLPNDDTYCRYAHKCECTQCCIHLYVKMNIYPFFFHKCVAVHFDESTTAYEKSAHALFVLSRGSGISQLESFWRHTLAMLTQSTAFQRHFRSRMASILSAVQRTNVSTFGICSHEK